MRKFARFQNMVALALLLLIGGGVVFLVRTFFPAQIVLLPFLLVGGLVIGSGAFLLLAGFSSSIVYTLIRPQRRAAPYPDLERTLNLPVERISFCSFKGGHQVHGFYLSRQDSTTTVVLSPGYRRGLKDILEMCKPLWDAGHQVLAFEYHGHGGVVGVPITLGYREVNDFLGAIAYIKQRDPSTHIGAMGYSMGAAVTLMGAARTQDVEAVVADSAFASSWSAVELAVHRAFRLRFRLPGWLLTLLYSTTDLLLWWCAGYRFHQVEPYQDVAKIAPRPLLFIHGTNDAVVSLDNATRLYEAAHFPKHLWLIEGARHTKGYLVDRPTYHQHVLAFFECALSKASKLRHIWQGSEHQPPFFLPSSLNEINDEEEIENVPTRLLEGETSDFAQSTRKVLETSQQKDNNRSAQPELMHSASGGFHEPRK